MVSPGPSKGKADKGRKLVKKPPGKVEAVEVRIEYFQDLSLDRVYMPVQLILYQATMDPFVWLFSQ